ncbi:MAG: hypothetical protein BWZ11_01266 [Bacteroidetes bacterium ADurb.BinA395]|nr:MAG: hypothetical protein BWZ11_01266 [Bacteroidetes bacterium ADurb.BinA395]
MTSVTEKSKYDYKKLRSIYLKIYIIFFCYNSELQIPNTLVHDKN